VEAQPEYERDKEVIQCEAARAHADAFGNLYPIDSEDRFRLLVPVIQYANATSRQAELSAR
jgi:hypothetical protein